MGLKDILTEDLIDTQVDVANWEEAVRAVGRLMVRQGAIEERYIDGMIRTAKELGPYIVIAPGIAIPHSRPEDGVLRNSMAFITLKTPIEFGNKDNDPVRLVIAFGAVDKDQHIATLADLARILEQPDKVQALQSATNAREFMDIMLNETTG